MLQQPGRRPSWLGASRLAPQDDGDKFARLPGLEIRDRLSPPLIPAQAGIQNLLVLGPRFRGYERITFAVHPRCWPSVNSKVRFLFVAARKFLTRVMTPRLWPSSRSPRVSSRGIAKAGRDAASRAFAPCKQAPGRLRHRALRKTGVHKSRGGAPRGERPALLDARRFANACGPTLLAREGCRAPERLSALRSLIFRNEGNAKLGEQLPREKDDACHELRYLAPLAGRGRIAKRSG